MSLNIEFLSVSRGSQQGKTGGKYYSRQKSVGMFWWTIAITLLLGLCVFCWFFSIYVFAHPEQPFSYELLSRLEKLDDLKNYEVASPTKDLESPKGKFFAPKEFYATYRNHPQLAVANDVFKRSYITNYSEEAPIYLKGTFKVTQVRPLNEKDVFRTGLVVRAQSKDYPNVWVEYVMPSDKTPEHQPELNTDWVISSGQSCAAVLHIQPEREDSLCATVVPLLYGDHRLNETMAIHTAPPKRLNIRGRWPITDGTLGNPDASAAVAVQAKIGS